MFLFAVSHSVLCKTLMPVNPNVQFNMTIQYDTETCWDIFFMLQNREILYMYSCVHYSLYAIHLADIEWTSRHILGALE